jgi:glucose/mannose-6-phosphate isomerase
MSVLDQPDQWMPIDPKGMYSLVEKFPEQVEATVRTGRDLGISSSGTVHSIIVTGLGGSAIGGDLARSIAGRDLKIPFVVNRDYALPAFVDASTIVFACSYSGNTEETLSAYRQAAEAKASIFCITSGGKLQSLADTDGNPVLMLPEGLPPRAALGHSLFMLLSAMQALGVIPDMTGSIDETLELLVKLRDRYSPMNPESSNPAKTIAHSLHGKVVALYGSSAILDATAFRWRSQIEENAKNLAFHHVLPEMNHNELVGWLYPIEVLKTIGVVLLRDKGDHPQVQRRFELTKEIVSGRAGTLHELWSEGESLLARVMSLIYLGDFVSLYLAYLNNTDPTPVEVIDYLKSRLSTADPV